jgi:hypothetical protein
VKNVQLKTPVSFTHFASKFRRKHISPTGDPPPAMTPSSNFFQRTSIAKRPHGDQQRKWLDQTLNNIQANISKLGLRNEQENGYTRQNNNLHNKMQTAFSTVTIIYVAIQDYVLKEI